MYQTSAIFGLSTRWIKQGLLIGSVICLSSACSIIQPEPVRQNPRYAVLPGATAEQQMKALDGAIYSVYRPIKLFEDTKARRIGDLLTILLSEKTDANTKSSTNTAKDSDLTLEGMQLFGEAPTAKDKSVLENSGNAARKFSGSGDTSQSNSLTGEITVTVTQVMDNGNLLVAGEKIISINQGAEFVRLAGIIRPEDIRDDNTVLSSKVANAQISYGGGGALADANAQGWLSRFFNSDWWPF